MVRIACAQMAMSANMEENYQKSLDYVRRAATAGAGIICFPKVSSASTLPNMPVFQGTTLPSPVPIRIYRAFARPAGNII